MKKLFALVLVVLVGLGAFIWFDPFGYAGSLSLEDEERVTRLQVTQGEVLVNGQLAVDGQILSPGDRIETSEKTQASILYFDDSVTRLSADTKVQLKVLDSADYYAGKAEIELVVEDGEAWTNVPPQTAKEYIFGVSTRDVHATIRGTTLNVLVEAETSVVQAANHSVEVRAAVDLRAENQLLLKEGEEIEYGKVKVLAAGEAEEETEVKLGVKRVIPQASLQRDWFSQNTQEDRLYEKNLLSERIEKQKKNVGALPGTIGYRLKKVRETVTVQFASDADKEKLEQAVLERRFIEAQLLKAEGKDAAAQKQSNAAKAGLQKVSQTNAKLAQEILIRQQEVVKTALPGDAAYFLKTELRAIESQVASDADRGQVEERQLQRKILELHDAEKEENLPQADIEIQRIDLQTEVRALPQAQQKNILPALPYILEAAEVQEVAPEPEEEVAPEDFGTGLSEEEIAQLEAEAKANAEATAVVETPVVEEEVQTEAEVVVEEEETTPSGATQSDMNITAREVVNPPAVVAPPTNTGGNSIDDLFNEMEEDGLLNR